MYNFHVKPHETSVQMSKQKGLKVAKWAGIVQKWAENSQKLPAKMAMLQKRPKKNSATVKKKHRFGTCWVRAVAHQCCRWAL